MSARGAVIFIDDDEHVCRAAGQTLRLAEYDVTTFRRARRAMGIVTDQWPGVLVADVRMPDIDGFAMLRWTLRQDPDLPVILVTGHGDVSMAVKAMREGAYDFIEKPLSADHLVDVVTRAMEKRRLVLDNRALRAEVAHKDGLESVIIGRSRGAKELRRMILKIADTGADVLICGETGTGKELVARCLHNYSRRRDQPFVAINCGAIPESIIENELFGHDPGAYTGADRLYIGKFEQADGGTLFLDEIESMPLELQVRLVRVLQERSLERLGGTETFNLDIRVIAATKRNLKEAIERGEFRADLYYRLNVAYIEIPPLRQRVEDIPLLFGHFIHRAAERLDRPPPDAVTIRLQRFMQHSWPGNVRELQNTAERVVLGIDEAAQKSTADAEANMGRGLQEQLEAFEKSIIEQELRRNRGNITATYEALGLPRKTLYYKMKKHRINRDDFTPKLPGQHGNT